MALTFEWDNDKAAANRTKHGISFEEAATLFADPLSLTIADPDHSVEEQRFATIVRSQSGRTLVVVHVDRGTALRLISARPATRRERKTYEEG